MASHLRFSGQNLCGYFRSGFTDKRIHQTTLIENDSISLLWEKDCFPKARVIYKIHPLFAGLSMISTALLAFVDRASYCKFLTYQQLLLLLNTIICFISALAAFPLSKLMIGNLHAKKWIVIQGKLSILYAALAFCPGTVGRVMVHLNWALLFASGAIERIWILCIMTQLDIPGRKTFLKFYSPQMKVAAIGGIPLGLVTYFFRR